MKSYISSASVAGLLFFLAPTLHADNNDPVVFELPAMELEFNDRGERVFEEVEPIVFELPAIASTDGPGV